VTFDIPDGKRLVMEAVPVQASVPAGQRVRVFLDVLLGIGPVLSVLPVQSPGPILGSEYYVANQPFKLRKDAMPQEHRRDPRPGVPGLVNRRGGTAGDDPRIPDRSLIAVGVWRRATSVPTRRAERDSLSRSATAT
jgi:hypothetical protein